MAAEAELVELPPDEPPEPEAALVAAPMAGSVAVVAVAAAAYDDMADSAAAELFIVLTRTESMTWTTPLAVIRSDATTLAVDMPEVT